MRLSESVNFCVACFLCGSGLERLRQLRGLAKGAGLRIDTGHTMTEPSDAHSPTNDRLPQLRLRVSRVAESQIRSGHPWVFSDSVREHNRVGKPGELAVIYDRNNRFLAIGLFDPDSPIQVRILHHGKPCTIDDAWFGQNLQQALQVRERLFGSPKRMESSDPRCPSEPGPSPNPLPGGEGETTAPYADATPPSAIRPMRAGVPSPGGEGQGEGEPQAITGYRLINGESDGWPGLVLDRYGNTYVLKLYSLAWLQRLETVQSLLIRAVAPERLVLRLSRNIQEPARSQFNRADGEVLTGPAVEVLPIFTENGLCFEADVVRGQKTGFFLDQRENRRRIEDLAADRRVLNAFSFSGGFSLHAARGGACSVTDLDISSHALESARRNFALNASDPIVSRCRHECVRDDVFEWVRRSPDREFDLIILDPPSLARRETERAGAITAYHRLATDAIRWLAEGGVLFAASCSAHVSAEEFFDAVQGAYTL